MTPKYMISNGVRLTRLVQRPGEIIITSPIGVHGGINLGFNVNEALNFVVPEWEPYGMEARVCPEFGAR